MDQKKIQIVIDEDDYENISEYVEIVEKLPFISSIICEIDEEYFDIIQQYREINVFKNTQVQAHMNVARKSLSADFSQNKDIDGQGVNIAILDTGIDPHVDFLQPKNRIVHFVDFTSKKKEPYDDNGHGTHVSGIACGSGYASLGKYMGIAPSAGIVSLKILDYKGIGDSLTALKALQWVYENQEKYNIHICNLSIGTEESEKKDPLLRAVEKLWDSGIVVVIAVGNNGPEKHTVTSPGSSRKVITVGASDDGSSVSIWGNKLINFSSRGPTKACIVKPDVVAPGSNIVSCLSKTALKQNEDLKKDKIIEENYIALSGTSMSTPMVSGAIALLLEKHPTLTPNEIKLKLIQSAKSLHYEPNQEGFGQIDIGSLLSEEAAKQNNDQEME